MAVTRGLRWKGRRAPARAVAQPATLVEHEAGAGRLLLFWSRPHRLSEGEGEDWVRDEVQRQLRRHGIEHARLTRLGSASPGWSAPWDWLLELDVPSVAHDRTVPAAWPEWLGDLRLLGMDAAAMIAVGGQVITAGCRPAALFDEGVSQPARRGAAMPRPRLTPVRAVTHR